MAKKKNGVKRALVVTTWIFAIVIIVAVCMMFYYFHYANKKTVTKEDVSTYLSQDQIIADPMSGFSHLSEDEQQAYIRILKELQAIPEDIGEEDRSYTIQMEGNNITIDQLKNVYRAISADHPELFFIDNYEYTYLPDSQMVQSVRIITSMTKDEIRQNQDKLNTYKDEVLKALPGGDYENAKYLHDYIIDHTQYDVSAPNNQNLISVVDGASVCAGYAEMYQYLLNQAGLFATTVYGTTNTGQTHAWNLVKLDNSYGWVDPTWDDPSFNQDDFDSKSYQYFGVSSADLAKTHTIDSGFQGYDKIEEPSWNYFKKEGLDFNLNDSGSLNAIIQAIRNAAQSGQETVFIRLADMGQVNQVLTDLSNDSISRDYNLTYVKDPNYPILMFIF